MKSCIRAALACALAVSPALAQEAVPLKTLPFSPARQAGDLLFISGQIARTADGADVKESVAAETHQTMKNIGRILEEHGYAYDDLSDIEDYHEMNKAYASYFKEQFPARACTGGAQIVFDFRVEIAAVAYKDTDSDEHHDGADEDGDGHHDGADED
ncbi:MAG: RidA family protein [Candidatus Latescibacteria bacterium]|nr:RidA family protein [Candidatus Latescibacterota bacterium]